MILNYLRNLFETAATTVSVPLPGQRDFTTIGAKDVAQASTLYLLIVGGCALAIGIVLVLTHYFIMIPKIRRFKERQLIDYRNENPRKTHLPYEKTGLYLPSWNRATYNMPLFLGATSLIIGIFMIIIALAK